MYDVRATAGLTEAILQVAPEPEEAGAGAAVAGVAAVRPAPIAILGVQGISPIQQYAFQDQIATGMLGYLNALEAQQNSGHSWRTSVYWPRVQSGANDPVLKPSALRLYRDDELTPDAPTSRVYDVYEGYWSPYSKGKTNVASLLNWLLSLTFLGTSSTARIPASWSKLFWDFGYILGALKLALLLLALALVAGSFAWSQFVALFLADPSKAPPFWEFAFDPLHQITALPWYAWFP